MAFNAPFGQVSQPAFGQPPQQPQSANPFGPAVSSSRPPGGKITFGARATGGQQPSGPDAQPAAFFGAPPGGSQSNQAFGTGSFVGNGAANPLGQGGSASFMNPGISSLSGGFGAFTGTGFGNSQPSGQGFPASGAPAAAATPPAPAALTPASAFAQPRTAAEAQPAAKTPSTLANGFGTSPFSRLGSPAPTVTASSAAQPSTSNGPTFGQQQAASASAFGFSIGQGSGTNPFAAPSSGAPVQPVDFGRAAKRKQAQQQQSGSDQPHVQVSSQQPHQQLKRPKSPALVPRQLSSQHQPANVTGQSQPPSSDMSDPAALAARSQRFGPPRRQSDLGGPAGRPSASAAPTDRDGDITDDQQGTMNAICNCICASFVIG